MRAVWEMWDKPSFFIKLDLKYMHLDTKGRKMLPFLKNQQEGSASSEVEPITRKHDDDFDMVDAIAEDMLDAMEKKDRGRLKAALQALCEYIREEDMEQDQAI